QVSLDVPGPTAPAGSSAVFRLIAPLQQQDLVAVDREADPLGFGANTGSLFLLGEEPGEGRILYSDSALVDPVSAVRDRSGDIVILDRRANPGGFDHDTGAVFRLDVSTGELTAAAVSDSFANPAEIIPDGAQGFLIVDESARLGSDPQHAGAVFVLDSLGAAPRLLSADPSFLGPRGVVRAGDGSVYVADAFADPNGFGGNTGAVFGLDGLTGAVTDTIQSPEFRDPVDLDLLPDGRLLLTDMQADPVGYGTRTGALFTIDPQSGAVEVFAHSPLFTIPFRSLVTTDGTVLVTDRSADLPGAPENGAVFSVDLETGAVSLFGGMEEFQLLLNLLQVPYAAVTLVEMSAADADDPPLYPGDVLEFHARITNIGRLTDPAAALTDTLPSLLELMPDSYQSDTGDFQTDGQRLVWSGPVGPGDTVSVRYEARVRDTAEPGSWLLHRPVIRGGSGRLRGGRLLRHFVASALQPGVSYIVDRSADPLEFGGSAGAVFEAHLPTGRVKPLLSGEVLQTPVDLEILSAGDQTLAILDADADPLGFGENVGAVFAADLITGELSLLATSEDFFDPAQMLVVSEQELLVVDPLANPLDLPVPGSVGPGAVFRVRLPEGAVEVVYSDTLLQAPTGIALDTQGGLYIADVNVNPNPEVPSDGAVFRLDLATLELQLVTADSLLREPARVAVHPNGDLFILDRMAGGVGEHGVGSVLRLSEGELSIFAGAADFRSPTDLFLDGNASLFVVDRVADPLALGGSPGALFRYNPSTASFITMVSDPSFARPMAGFIRVGLTPVLLRSLSAAVTPGGAVRLEWEVEGDVQPAGFLILRREIEDTGDYAPLNPQAPVTGSGLLEYVDAGVDPGAAYSYLIAALTPGGDEVRLGPVQIRVPGPRYRLALQAPQPNPSAGGATLHYSVPRRGRVTLQIYDVGGRLARRLVDRVVEPGRYTAVWDGRNDGRRPVGSGIYFVRLQAAGGELVRRLVMVH
ncbi:MAG: T9SS type A sorting domain-containing protein, partial [Candidatus Eisenbacteria bacterium]|nr:T9SS type A sorting domain-containing protein [Candidatus Eisenbacteria bacterium]